MPAVVLAEAERVAVLGAGSVGTFVGGLLSLAGYDVSLIGRATVLDPIRCHGLTIVSPSGSTRVAHPRTITGPPPEVQYDIVLVTVRAYDIPSVADLVNRLAGSRATILTLQNGVGSDEQLFQAVPRDQVVAATLTASVGFSGPGIVRRYNRSSGLAWAQYGRGVDRDGISRLLASMKLPVWKVASPQSLRWSKLLLNAVGSAQGFVLDMDVSEIVSRSDLFGIEQLAFRETGKVMAALKIPMVDLPGYRVTLASKVMALPSAVAQAVLARRIAKARGGKPPSMLVDRSSGNHRTESSYLNGAVASGGRSVGVPTPVNSGLDALVHRMTESEKDREQFRHNPAQLVDYLCGQSAILPE